jgi:RHS repeat-associated protein
VTDQTGAVTARRDYLPFGQEIGPTVGLRGAIPGYGRLEPTTQKFTGKERDPESGLDFFGARYYSSPHGRFTSVDPSLKSAIPELPQSWNRYSYAYNNPLVLVDRNGKWPTSIHNRIIKTAFPGLSANQQKILMNASYNTDFNNEINGKDPQAVENSFIHSMCDGKHGQTKAEAKALAEQFKEGNFSRARELQAGFVEKGGKGISDAALTPFGNALHPVMDSSSPPHGDFLPYYGGTVELVGHGLQEASISDEQLKRATADARQVFREVFGQEALNQAVGKTDTQPQVDDPEKRKRPQ